MATIDHIQLYVFEIFDKTETNDKINQISEIFGVGQDRSSQIRDVSIGKIKFEKRIEWKLTDNDKMFMELNKLFSKDNYNLDLSHTKVATKKITIMAIENEDLPYFIIIFSILIDTETISNENMFKEIKQVVYPYRLYLESFKGITTQIFSLKPSCPFYTEIKMLYSPDEITKLVQISSTMADYESILHGSVRQDFLVDKSKILREFVPLNTLPYNFNLLSIAKVYGNAVVFVGHLEQLGINGLMTPYMVTMSHESFESGEESESFFFVQAKGYDSLFFPSGASGTMIYIVSLFCWLTYFERKIANVEKDFTKLRTKIRDEFQNKKKINLDKYLLELDKNGSNLADLIANVGELSRKTNISLGEFEKGRNSSGMELPVLPTKRVDISFWSEVVQKLGSPLFLQALAVKTTNMINDNKTKLEQLLHENEILHNHVNNLVHVRTQKTMKRQGWITVGLTVAVIFLTVVLLYYTQTQFNIENFESEFLITKPHIILNDKLPWQRFEYLSPIKLNTLTSHNYRYTVSVVEDSFKLRNLGECFLVNTSEIDLAEPSIFFLNSGANEKLIEPKFRLNYDDDLPYFEPERLEQSVLYDVGTIQFKIEGQNLQDSTKNMIKNVTGDVSIRIPWNYTTSYCNE